MTYRTIHRLRDYKMRAVSDKIPAKYRRRAVIIPAAIVSARVTPAPSGILPNGLRKIRVTLEARDELGNVVYDPFIYCHNAFVP